VASLGENLYDGALGKDSIGMRSMEWEMALEGGIPMGG